MDIRLLALWGALVLYALFGSPTPSEFGVVEVIVGGALTISIGFSGVSGTLRFFRNKERWFLAGHIFLIFGIVSGSIGALLAGASVMAVFRDLIAFGFLFLPLFLFPYFLRFSGNLVYLYAFLAIGIVFAVRASVPVLGAFPFRMDYDSLYYLANSPAVLFAGLFFLGQGMLLLAERISVQSLLKAFLCFGMSVLVIVPLVLTAQRASLGAFAVYAIIAFGIMFLRAPFRMGLVGVMIASFIAVFAWPLIDEVYEGLSAKTHLVGVNMRFEEWAGVVDAICVHPMTFLFGIGWGTLFSSPAVADIYVTYTHSLMSYILLKLGVVGFVLCGAYVVALLAELMREFRCKPLFVMAVIAPLLIDVVLYAAYKSLDFGLLLGLVPFVMSYRREFHDKRQSEGIASSSPLMYSST